MRGLLHRFRSQYQRFFALESSSGLVLLAFAVIAFVLANSPWGAGYHRFWQVSLDAWIDPRLPAISLHHVVNDGLMAVFFFLVGLEIKREVTSGELSTLRKAMLPVVGAVGGMVVPALLYLLFNSGTSGAAGWGIPMATDIAFSLGVLALLGNRAPLGLRVFLTAFAIVDDLGAVLVIAFFYTATVQAHILILAGAVWCIALVAGVMRIQRLWVYAVIGGVLWLLMLRSGVHATIAGVLMAAAVPGRGGAHTGRSGRREGVEAADSRPAPLERFEHLLHPWVAFGIMPIFALANAGVTVERSIAGIVLDPIALGVMTGLVAGKQIGITTLCWIAVRLNAATLPAGVTWRHIHGVSILGGIGFTMSMFISALAFGESGSNDIAKIAILASSLVAALAGWIVLRSVPVGRRRSSPL